MTNEPRTQATEPAAPPRTPEPARVPGNLWTEIQAPEIGALVPAARLSVILVGDDPEGRLRLTLAALEAQTYPMSLVEVLALEASPPPPGGALEVRSASSPDAAEGEVFLFLRAGSIPGRRLLEAHARWHHAVSDAVSVGLTPAVEAGGLTAEKVARATRQDGLEELLAGRGGEDGHFLAAYLERTRGLTERRPDLFWTASQGNAAMRAETFRAAGGLGEEPGELALLDLAWRLECLGCVFVFEREAVSHRTYPGGPPPPAADVPSEAAPEPTDHRVANLIPLPGFRPRGSARLHRRPAIVVNVPVGEESAAEVLETVDAILRGRFSDLEIRLQVPGSHAEHELIAEAVAADPRLSLAPHSSEGLSDSAFQATLPAAAIPGPRTFGDVYGLMVGEGLGALHATVPGRFRSLERLGRARRPVVEVRATGALARARRLSEHDGEPPEGALARLFGERWISGTELGIRRRGALGRTDDAAVEAAGGDLARERAEHLRNRARAATMQARLDRNTQTLVRERMRANREQVRADRFEARLAAVSPRYWARWRGRQVAQRSRGGLSRVGQFGSSYRSDLRLRARQAGARLRARARG